MAGPLVPPAEAALVSPAPARELNAPGCTPAGTSAASGPSVNCTPAVGGASTLAELNAMVPTLIHGPTTWIAGGRTGAYPGSQLHGQQLAQRAGGAIGVSSGAICVIGGSGIGVSGAGTGIGA